LTTRQPPSQNIPHPRNPQRLRTKRQRHDRASTHRRAQHDHQRKHGHTTPALGLFGIGGFRDLMHVAAPSAGWSKSPESKNEFVPAWLLFHPEALARSLMVKITCQQVFGLRIIRPRRLPRRWWITPPDQWLYA